MTTLPIGFCFCRLLFVAVIHVEDDDDPIGFEFNTSLLLFEDFLLEISKRSLSALSSLTSSDGEILSGTEGMTSDSDEDEENTRSFFKTLPSKDDGDGNDSVGATCVPVGSFPPSSRGSPLVVASS